MKKLWGWILGALGIITALFFVERGKRKQAEAELESSEYKANDQLLKQKQEDAKADRVKEETTANKLKEQNESDKASQENLTPDQVADFWKNRK